MIKYVLKFVYNYLGFHFASIIGILQRNLSMANGLQILPELLPYVGVARKNHVFCLVF